MQAQHLVVEVLVLCSDLKGLHHLCLRLPAFCVQGSLLSSPVTVTSTSSNPKNMDHKKSSDLPPVSVSKESSSKVNSTVPPVNTMTPPKSVKVAK